VPGARPGPSTFDSHRTLTDAEACQMLAAPPPPGPTTRMAAGLDHAALAVGLAAGALALGAAALLASPLFVVGSLGGTLGGTVDPAIIGVLTLPGTGWQPGTPAAWFLLTHWDWRLLL